MTEILDPREAFRSTSQHFGARISPVARIVKPVRLPWRVVIDTAEQQPYTFANLSADADRQNRPIAVETVTRCLGRYPHSLGDYSLEAVDGSYHDPAAWCYVERKSLEDFQATILGYPERRARFESELANLQAVILGGGQAKVVVEADLEEMIYPVIPVRNQRHATKNLHRSWVRLEGRFGNLITPCGSRRLAEITTFRFLESFWKHRIKARKEG